MNSICPTARGMRASLTGIAAVTFAVLVALASASLPSGCASSQVIGGDHDAVTRARLSFDAASIDYEAALKSVTELRAARLVTDGQWSIAVNARNTVAEWAPLVRAALNVWRATGTKPESFDSSLAKFNAAFADIRTVNAAAGGPR